MVKKIERENNLNKVENIITKLIVFLAAMIIFGIIISVYQKNIAFWITSISSVCMFFSIFILIVVIFIKEFKTK